MTKRHPRLNTLTCILLCTAVLLVFWVPSARAQADLDAISISKLRVPSADPVPSGKLELAATWQMGWYRDQFTRGGGTESIDGLSTHATLGLRFIAGLFDNRDVGMELGFTLPVIFNWLNDYGTQTKTNAVGFGDIPIGLKVRVFAARTLSLALAMSVSTPTGTQADDLADGYARVSGGVIVSANPAGGFTMDVAVSAGGTPAIKAADRDAVAAWGVNTSVGMSWIFSRGFMRRITPVIELAWSARGRTRGADRLSQKLALNLGLTFQLSRRILLVQGAQVDLAGQNIRRGAMWLMSTNFLI